MGDIADMMVDQMIERGGWGLCRSKKPVVCKHCGSRAVKWRETDAGWRLFNTARTQPGNRNSPHNCRDVASADEFEVVTP